MSGISKKIKARLAGSAIVAMLAFASTSASAVAVLNGTFFVDAPVYGPVALGTLSQVNPGFITAAHADDVGGLFTDEYTFDISSALLSSTQIGSISVDGKGDVTFTSVVLDGATILPTSTGATESYFLGNFGLTAGTHTLTLVGSSNGTVDPAGSVATYTGSINFSTPAVPEAATWGMMVLGFGIMGAGIRSRKRSMVLA